MGRLRRSVSVICRLCLEKCVDFKVVEDYIQEVLDILLLKINLAVSKEPVMCINCAAMLMKCFDFKATCFYTHDYIAPFHDDEKISKLDLRKVYISNHENVVDIPGDHGVCSFCMGLSKEYMAISLDDEEGNVMLEKLIEKHLPELELSTIEEPIICTSCHELLKNYSHFVTSCLIVEERIMEYSKLKGADVEMADILQLTSKKISKVAGNTSDVISTERKFRVNMRNADEQVGHENNSFVLMEEQKVLLNEDVEIKTDQHDFDRFSDGVVVVSSQPVTNLCGNEKGSMSKGGPLKTSNKHKKAHGVSKARMQKCDFCSLKMKYRANLKRHISMCHKNSSEETVYQSDSCSFKTKHKNNLCNHMLIHKDPSEIKMYQCNFCPFQTKHRGNLKNHEMSHRDNSKTTIYQCDFCAHETKYRANLERHMLIHKNSSEVTTYQCVSCSFKTRHKHGLRLHALTHKDPSEVKMYQCNFCPFQTKYKSNLKKHAISHRDNSETTIYQCDFCAHETKYRANLERHMLIHKNSSEVTTYQCDSCSFKTRHKYGLRLHALIHKDPSEVKMHQCHYCSFKTKHKQSLGVHIMLNHKDYSEVTTYQCTSCPYQAKLKSALKRHLLIHNTSKMYQCDSCSYHTNNKGSLKRHMTTHKLP